MGSQPLKSNLHSIIVLTYKRADLIKARIEELKRFYSSRADVEILIADNGSTNKELMLTLGAASYDPDFRVERINENLGFGGGFNEAVKRSKGDIIYLISDDVQIYGDFLGHIERELQDRVWCSMWNDPDEIHGIVVGQALIDHDAGWNKFGETKVPYLMGFFLAMAREIWDSLGGFDAEAFHPCDYEDVDLSYRAAKKGFDLIKLPNLPITHLVAGTIGYNPQRFEHTVKMRAAFAKKWDLPNIPERP